MNERQLQREFQNRSWPEVSAEMERRGEPCSQAMCQLTHSRAMKKLRERIAWPVLSELLLDTHEPSSGMRPVAAEYYGEAGLTHLSLTEEE